MTRCVPNSHILEFLSGCSPGQKRDSNHQQGTYTDYGPPNPDLCGEWMSDHCFYYTEHATCGVLESLDRPGYWPLPGRHGGDKRKGLARSEIICFKDDTHTLVSQ